MIGDVSLKAFVGSVPLPRALFDLRFATSRNPVTLVVGPADEFGELRLADEEVECRYQQAVGLAVMDYGPWSGEAFVGVLNREAIRAAREGYASWKSVQDLFPSGYLAQLDDAEQALQGHDGEQLQVVVSASSIRSMVREV